MLRPQAALVRFPAGKWGWSIVDLRSAAPTAANGNPLAHDNRVVPIILAVYDGGY
jgi:hypothetical protein